MRRTKQFSDETGIEFLPVKDTLEYQRETGLADVPYEKEKEILSCFLTGDADKFDRLMEELQENGIFIGPMAAEKERTIKYAEAVFAALACRYCIEGGMPQMEAFRRCDEITRSIDETEEVLNADRWKLFLGQLRVLMVRMQEIRMEVAARPEIRRACSYVLGNLHSRVTVSQMAEAAGLSVSYFKAIFQQEVGIAPGAYVMQQKIQYACRLLSETARSITDIAYTLGFCSQSHFAKAFRKEIGRTPSSYRKEKQEIHNK